MRPNFFRSVVTDYSFDASFIKGEVSLYQYRKDFCARAQNAGNGYMKKKLIFTISLILYAFLLVLGASMLLSKVKGQLAEYESAQPEKAVEMNIKAFVNAAKNGTISQMITLPKGFIGEFDENSPFVKPYVDLIAEGNITYKKLLDEGGSDSSGYALYSGDRQVAKMRIRGVNERTKLLIFTCSDWELVSIEPITTASFNLTFPDGITVTVDGNKMSGILGADGNVSYSASSFSEIKTITAEDEYGHVVEVDTNNVDKIKYKSFEITVPDSFKVETGGQTLVSDSLSKIEMTGFDMIKEYMSSVPSLVTYKFSILTEEGKTPDVKVTDNIGGNVEVDYEKGYLKVTELTKTDSIPSEISDVFDVLKSVETHSLFTSDDLSGKQHGFATLAAYLIEDSYLYKSFYEYATGIDITFTSNHTLMNPAFVDESVGGFVKYSDNCFSCEVKLTKRMKLTRTGQIREDKIDATYYYVKVDATDDGVDDPQWYMVYYRSNI